MTEAAIEQQNTDERLKDMFRRLMELYERHAQERQLLVKEKEEINRLVQLLVSQTKEVGQYENGIRKRIQDCIKESAGLAMEQIGRSVIEKNNQLIEELINKIGQVCKSMEKLLETNRLENARSSWKIIAVALLSSVLSSFLLTSILIPKPTLPLTKEQIGYLQDGQMLVQMWPKLTKQEKDRLKAISHEVLHTK